MQQKQLSLPWWVTWIAKIPLEFGDIFCLPCEPIAWIWHEGNDAIRCHPTAIIDVHLPEIHDISLVRQNFYIITIALTELALMNMLLWATKSWAPARMPASLMFRYWRWRGSTPLALPHYDTCDVSVITNLPYMVVSHDSGQWHIALSQLPVFMLVNSFPRKELLHGGLADCLHSQSLGRPFRCHVCITSSFQCGVKAMEQASWKIEVLFTVQCPWVTRIIFLSVRKEGACWAGRVDRWTFMVPQSVTWFLFDVASPETQGHGELAPTFVVVRKIWFLRSHRHLERKEPEVH